MNNYKKVVILVTNKILFVFRVKTECLNEIMRGINSSKTIRKNYMKIPGFNKSYKKH